MKRSIVGIVGLLMVVLFVGVVVAAPIPVSDVAKYVDKTVTVEGKVLKVGQSTKSNTYFLNFTQQKNGFTVVIFAKTVSKFEAAKVDIKSLEGKTVQVTGKIQNPPQYGIEIILNDPSEIKVVGGTAAQPSNASKTAPVSTAKPTVTGKIIQVAEVEMYIDQSGTVEGKVVKVGLSQKSNTYFLNFTEQRNGFTVVVFDKVEKQFEAKKIDPYSFQGKTVQVSGNITKPPSYGVEIILDSPDNIKIIK
jgi:DNA/RNA endonuclease YhcR with UshA esterase domain